MIERVMEKQSEQKRQNLSDAYKKHSGALFRFSFLKLNDKEKAIDILQETFMKAWIYLSTNKPIKNLRALLYKISSNLVIDEYRRRKPMDSLETLNEQGFEPSVDEREKNVMIMDASGTRNLLKQVPEPYRKTLFMKFFKNLSLEEIAKITHEKKNVVAVHVHRGMTLLRKLYKGNKGEK